MPWPIVPAPRTAIVDTGLSICVICVIHLRQGYGGQVCGPGLSASSVSSVALAGCTHLCSASGESRLPLLQVGGNAFAGVIALEQALLQLAFERERVGEAHLQSRLNRALDVPDGFGRAAGRHELLRPFQDCVTERPAVEV